MNRVEQSLNKEIDFLGKHIRGLARQGESVPVITFVALATAGKRLQARREANSPGKWKPQVPKDFPGLRVNSQ